MKIKTTTIKKLDDLLSLTDMALLHAEKSDLSGVRKCLDSRRRILESIKNFREASADQSDVKKRMQKLLTKDKAIDHLLRSLKEELKIEREKFCKIRNLKLRFNHKQTHIPNYIDKKV